MVTILIASALSLPVPTAHGPVEPTYDPAWPYKVTRHTTAGHLACDAQHPQLSGCDHVIGPGTHAGTIKIKAGKTDPAPGDMVCVLPGSYSDAEVWEVHGTAAEPITIRNCGGPVQVNNQFRIKRSLHLRLLGDGDVNTLYGIRITGILSPNNGSGLSIQELSRDIEVAYNDISAEHARSTLHFNTGKPVRDGTGNYVPRYDLVTGELFVQSGSHIHHNYLHDSAGGEGLYLGITGCTQEEFDAGSANEHSFVHDNIVMNNGGDGVQVGCSRKDTLIYNNYIYNSGFSPYNNLGHTKGIQLGRGSSALVFNNYVEKAANACVFLGGGPTDIAGRDIAVSVHNNIFIDCTEALGIHSDAQDIVDSGQRIAFANNTVVDMRVGHVWINHHHDDMVRLSAKNNLYVDDAAAVPHIWVNGSYEVGSNVQESGALILGSLAEAKFLDATGGNFNLLDDSPAVDAGVNAADLDVTDDINALPRDAIHDIGAAEFRPQSPGLVFKDGFD